MIKKGELTTRFDLTGEISANEQTRLLIQNNQIPKDYIRTVKTICQEQEEYTPDGAPRYFLDGIDENDLQDFKRLNENSWGSFTVDSLVTEYEIQKNELFDVALSGVNLMYGKMTSTYNLQNIGSERTIVIYFKPNISDVESGTKAIFSQRISSNIGYHLGILNGRLYTYAYNAYEEQVWNTYITSENIVENIWYQCIITHNDTHLKIFLNGIRRKDFDIVDGDTIDYMGPYRIGGMMSGYRFTGKAYGFCFISDYLSDQQAVSFYNNAFKTVKGFPEDASISGESGFYINYDIIFSNGWSITSGTLNAYFDLVFFGNGINIYGRTHATGAKFNVYMSGELIEEVDTNGSDEVILLSSVTGLIKTYHTLRIEVSEIPTAGDTVQIDYFEFLDDTFLISSIEEENLHEDIDTTTYPIEYSSPKGLPRFELDGIDETLILYSKFLNQEDENILTSNGASYYETSQLFDDPTKVINVGNGGFAYATDYPTSDGGTVRTFVSWFKPSDADINGVYGSVCSQRSTDSKGYHIGINASNNIYFRAYSSTGTTLINYDTTGGEILKANKWYCVVVAHDATNYYIYINGNLETSGTYSGTIDYTTNYFKMGTALTSNSFQFHGLIGPFFLISETWDNTKVNTFYDNAINKPRQLIPSAQILELSDFEFIQTNSSYKELTSSTFQSEYIISFKTETLSVYGSKDTDGGSFSWYLDDVLQDTISCYASSYSYEELFNFDLGEYKQVTLKIVNESSLPIRIGHFTFNMGENVIYDYSGKGNHGTLKNYSLCKQGRDDIVDFGKFEYALKFDRTDTNNITVEYPASIFEGLEESDAFLVGAWVKIIERETSGIRFNVIIGNYNNGMTGNGLVTFLYGQDPANTRDFFGIRSNWHSGDFILPELTVGNWYYFGFYANGTDRDGIIYYCEEGNSTINVVTFSFTAGQVFNTSGLADFRTGGIYSTDYSNVTIDTIHVEINPSEDINKYLRSIVDNTSGKVDDSTHVTATYYVDGKISLRQEFLNKYEETGTYYSNVIDLGGPLNGTGKLSMSKEIPQSASIIDIQTRTSEDALDVDSPTWSSWEDVNDIGVIQSPNRQYIQVRFTMTSTTDYSQSPTVSSIEIYDIDYSPFTRKAFSLPIAYENGKKISIAHDANDIHIFQELNGGNYITWEMPFESEKRAYFTNEKQVRLADDFYFIRNIKDYRTNGQRITKFYAEALFYDLAYKAPLKEKDFYSSTPYTIIAYILNNTGWSIQDIDTTSITRDFTIENQSNVLEMLWEVQKIFGGDLVFNNENQTVSLLIDSSEDNGLICAYGKNVESIIRTIDSSDIATKVYVYGEDDLNLSEVNNNNEYVENEVDILSTDRHKIITNTYFTDANELLSYANWKKKDFSKETYTYEIELKDLSAVNVEEPEINLGNVVTVFDDILNIYLKTRIVSIDYNVKSPQNTKIVLSNKIRQLGDDITEFEKYKRKFNKIKLTTLLRMVRFYLYGKLIGYGYVYFSYITVSGTPKVGATGQVNSTYLNIRLGTSFETSIIGRLYFGETIKILAISNDGKWYKISYK